jgi:protein-S-isoprenylcysteine O-methyltransferase Ste14
MYKLAVFILFSVLLLYISRKSLRVVRSHGFYRFFAWEAMLALLLINIGKWFIDPLSAWQIASWISLLASLILLINGGVLLLKVGKPDKRYRDDTLLDFEKTSVLVTSGIYRYIRHPLYGSLLFFAWGMFLKDVSWLPAGLVALATIFLFATAKADEIECIRFFGSSYEEYMTRTKMFVPFLL